MRVNIWLALRQAAHDKIRSELTLRQQSDVERTSDIPEWILRFFEAGAHDWRNLENKTLEDRVWFSQGAVWRRWHLWTLSFKVQNLSKLDEAVTRLTEQWPNMVKLAGAWDSRGNQLAPLDPRAANFIPDRVWHDEAGNEIKRESGLYDFNRVFGYGERTF